MNLFFSVPAAILLFILLGFWFMTEKLDLYSEGVFYKHTFFLTVSIVLSIICSILYMFYSKKISKTVFTLLTTGYLIGIVCFLYYKVIHFLSGFLNITQCKKFAFPFAGYSLFQVVVIIATQEKFNYLESTISLNSVGIMLLSLYFVCHILIIVVNIITNFKKIDRYSRRIYIVDCVIIAVGIVSEFVLKINGSINLILVLDTIYSLRYIENPKGNINSDFRCFKQNVLIPYLQEKYEDRNSCFVVSVGFGYFTTNATIENDLNKLKKEIVDEFLSVHNTKVFVGAEGNIFAINEDRIYENFVEDTKEMIDEKMINFNSIASVKIGITSCADILLVENELILLNHLSSCLKTIFAGIKQIGYKEVTKEIIDSIVKEEDIKNKIIWALNNDKLEAFYQPIFSSKKNNFTSAEALARIRNENGTVMLPGAFISIAERNGLIMQIGDRIYEKVCEFLSAPSSKEYNLDFISVNLSNTQCEDTNLATRYAEVAKKYGVDPSKIEFEINEKDFMNIKEKVMKNVEDFAKNGFRVALDGYGSAESSFYSLLDFPVTSLKLDMHLIWNYSESVIQRTVSQSIIRMAHALNIEIVAEGVETIGQLEDMVAQNVDHIQGYYFFIPMDTDDFKQFLRPTAFEVGEQSNVTAMDKINSIRKIGIKKDKQED